MDNGWVLLHRKLFEGYLWKQKPFSKGQAWIDLFANANHQEGGFWIRGIEVKLKRGQIGWSELTMAERWGWSRMKCRRFLNDLEMRQQIVQQKSHLTTIITIVNYEDYQKVDQRRDNRRYNRKTTDETQTKNVKNDKENKDEINLVMDEFYKFNPTLPYGHQAQREAAAWVIEKEGGISQAIELVRFVGSLKGKPFAPTITTPYKLKIKYAELEAYVEREKNGHR
jgi:hypothetical protein